MAKFIEDRSFVKKKKKNDKETTQKKVQSPSVSQVVNRVTQDTTRAAKSTTGTVGRTVQEQRRDLSTKRNETVDRLSNKYSGGSTRTAVSTPAENKNLTSKRNETVSRLSNKYAGGGSGGSISKALEPVKGSTRRYQGSRNPRILDTANEGRIVVPKKDDEKKSPDPRTGVERSMNPHMQDTPGAKGTEIVANTGKVSVEGAKQAGIGHLKTMSDINRASDSNILGSKIDIKSQEFQEDIAERKKASSAAEDKAFKALSDIQEKSERKVAKIKGDSTGFERALYDAAESGSGMLTDIGVGAITGTGQVGALASMASRTYGTTRGQAQKEGATESEDRIYSLLQAGKEVGTELMFPGVGLAKGYAKKGGISVAEKLANKATQSTRSKLGKDIVGGAVRWLGGIGEENAEEFAGWLVDPFLKDFAYGKAVRERTKASLSDGLPEITSPEQAQAVAAKLNSDEFIDSLEASYIENGMKEKDAKELAEMMRDYYAAYYSGDEDEIERLGNDIAEKVHGKSRTWNLKELGETFAATTLLTAATGAPGSIKAASVGAQYREMLGTDGLRQAAETLLNYSDDQTARKRAENTIRAIDEGREPYSTSVADLMSDISATKTGYDEKVTAANNLKAQRDEEEGLTGTKTPVNLAKGISVDMPGEATSATYEYSVNNAAEYADAYNSRVAEEDRISDQRINAVADTIGRFEIGEMDTGDIDTLRNSNKAEREIFKDATGIDLDQYNVTDKKGNIDVVKSNEAMTDALLAQNVENYVTASRTETAVWRDSARGEVVENTTRHMEPAGTAAVQKVLKGIDERDRTNYTMTAAAASYVYSAARNGGLEFKGKVRDTLTSMYPSVSETTIEQMYEAGLEDRRKAMDVARDKQVKIGEVMSSLDTSEPAPMRGNFYNETGGQVGGEELELWNGIARMFNVDIHLTADIARSAGIKDEDVGTGKGVTHGGYSKAGVVYLNAANDMNRNMGYVFMHEFTHHLRTFAPVEYQILEDTVRARWQEKDPGGFERAIERMRKTYPDPDMTDSDILEEIIANSAHEFLQDKEFAERIAADNPTFAKAVLDAIRDILRKLRALFVEVDIENDIVYDTIFSYLDMLEEGETLWLNMYTKALENRAAVGIATWERNAFKFRKSVTEDQSQQDADYMAAVEAGDMETAQKMVDEAAERAGYNVKGFHGTDAFFNEFKIGDIGYHIGTEGQAKSRIENTGLRSTQANRAPHIMPLYAKINSALEAAFDFGDWHGKHVAEMLKETEQFDYWDNYEEIEERLDEIAAMPDGKHADSAMREYLQELGYDGIVYFNEFEDVDDYTFDLGDSSYIAFESNQLKLADPVTYDDGGNVIPLSERFDQGNQDIRWSVTPEEADAHRQTIADEMTDLYGEAYTDNYKESGYLLPDGKLLRMGMDGTRGEDHFIADLAYSNETRADSVNAFINEGNIRYMPETGAINLGTEAEPTAKQYDQIEDFVNSVGVSEIEFTRPDGSTVDYKDYPYASGAEVVNDIKRFYRTGKIGGSDLSQFRWSMQSGSNAIGLDLSKENHQIVLTSRATGEEVKTITRDLVINSPLGALLKDSVSRGILPPSIIDPNSDAKDGVKFISDFYNMILKVNDPDLVYAISGTIGYDPTGTRVGSGISYEEIKEKGTKYPPIKTNSDPQYGTSFDLATICIKTQAVIDAMSEAMKRRKGGLTKKEVIEIVYKEVYDAGEPVPCPVCFVFARWVGLGGVLDTVWRLQNKYPAGMDMSDVKRRLDELNAKVDELIEASSTNGKKITGSDVRVKYYRDKVQRFNELEQIEFYSSLDDKYKAQLSEQYEFTDELKAEKDRIESELEILDDWSYLMNTRMSDTFKEIPSDILFDINAGREFAEEYPDTWKFRTSRGPGLGKAALPYSPAILGNTIMGVLAGGNANAKTQKGNPTRLSQDIQDINKNEFLKSTEDGELTSRAKGLVTKVIKKVRAQNLMNGQRVHTNNDYRHEYATDYMLAYIEMSAIGSKAQEYSKVLESMWFQAACGVELNCSVMPKGSGLQKNKKLENGKYLGIDYNIENSSLIVRGKDGKTREVKWENGKMPDMLELRRAGNEIIDVKWGEIETDDEYSLVFSDVTGAHIYDALMLAHEFDNVQPILVVTSPEHLRLAAKNPYITMYIPNHNSGGTNENYFSMMDTVGEPVEERTNFARHENEHEIKDATKEQVAARDLRTKILKREFIKKVNKKDTFIIPTEEEKAVLTKNETLRQLLIRFYGKDENGNDAKPNPKFVENFDENGNDADCFGVALNSEQASVIMPYEYWDKTSTVFGDAEKNIESADDQAKRYVDYMASIGYHPVFSGWSSDGKYDESMDFTGDTGYWKSLIDRCMYNNDGSYHKQRPVSVDNVDIGTLDPNWSRGMMFKPSQPNDPSKTSDIADRINEKVDARRAVEAVQEKEDNVDKEIKKRTKWLKAEGVYMEPDEVRSTIEIDKFSRTLEQTEPETDSTGSELSPGQIEYFKNSKARDEQGRLVPVYHTTDKAGFTVFDTDRSKDDRSIFFSDSYYVSQTYAEDAFVDAAEFYDGEPEAGYYTCYLNLENPLIIDAHGKNWDNISNSDLGIVDRRWEMFTEDRTQMLAYSDDGGEETVMSLKDPEGYEKAKAMLGPELLDKLETQWFQDDYGTISTKWDTVSDTMGQASTTRDIAEYAHENGYDGVIIRNVVDVGKHHFNGKYHGEGKVATDYIAFRSEQIKDTRNKDPHNVPDIRWSVTQEDMDAAREMQHEAYMDAFNSEELEYLESIYDAAINDSDAEAIKLLSKASTWDGDKIDAFYSSLIATDVAPTADDKMSEEGIRRVSTARNEFFAGTSDKWNDRWLTKGEVLKIGSVKRQVRELVKAQFRNSKSDRQYRSDMLSKVLVDCRLAYMMAKRGRTDVAETILWASARDMIDGVVYYDEAGYDEYSAIKNFCRTHKVNVPFGSENDLEGGLAQFRKHNVGRIRLVREGGANPEDFWTEMKSYAGESTFNKYFRDAEGEINESDNPADYLNAISAFLDAYKPYEYALTSDEAAEQAMSIASDLGDIVFGEGESIQSLADKYKAKYDAKTKALKVRLESANKKTKQDLETKYKQQIKDLKAQHRQNLKDAKKAVREQEREKAKARTKKLKETQREKLTEARKEAFKAGIKKSENRAHKRELVKRIEKTYNDLARRTLNPSKEKYVPEEFRAALAETLASIDLQSWHSVKREEKTGEVSQKVLKLRALQQALENLAKNKNTGDDIWIIDENLADWCEQLADRYEGKEMRKMSMADLETFDKVLRGVQHAIIRHGKVRKQGKIEESRAIGAQTVKDLKRRQKRKGKARTYKGPRGAAKKISMSTLTPGSFFERLGAFNGMYGELREGFDEYIRNEAEIIDGMEKILRKYYKHGKLRKKRPKPGSDIEKWRSAESAEPLKLTYGTIKMTVAQRMEFYELVKRGKQAIGHMTDVNKGGIICTPVQPGGRIERAKELVKGIETNSEDALPLTEADIQTIIGSLTAEQIQVADGLQQLIVMIGKKGNVAHRELYGYEIFDEENYYRIRTKETDHPVDINTIEQAQNQIKSWGSAKALTPGANNAIIIDDIFTSVADQCNQMNLYASYLVPLTDFMSVYNAKVPYSEDGDEEHARWTTVRGAIKETYGKQALHYIDKFVSDINGIKGMDRSGAESILDSMLSKAKATAVGANLSVAFQQPTAIVKAMAEIGLKYFLPGRGIKSMSLKVYDEMKKYCPIALWKSWGYYDTYMSRNLEDVMMNNWTRRDLLFFGAYGSLDMLAWSGIWQAVKAEQADKYPDMDHKSEEFLQICGRRASEVYDRTQVVDSTFTRSDAMRSKDTGMKIAGAFMSEPILTLDMLKSAWFRADELAADGKKGEAFALKCRTVSVVVLQAAVVAGARALADTWRGKDPGLPWDDDDDDDEEAQNEWYIRLAHNYIYDLIGQLHLEDNIIFFKDVHPVIRYMITQAVGYEDAEGIVRTAFTLLRWDEDYLFKNGSLLTQNLYNLADGITMLVKKLDADEDYDKEWYDILQKIGTGLGPFTGIPLGTIMRDLKPVRDKLFPEVLAAEMLPETIDTSDYLPKTEGEAAKKDKEKGKSSDAKGEKSEGDSGGGESGDDEPTYQRRTGVGLSTEKSFFGLGKSDWDKYSDKMEDERKARNSRASEIRAKTQGLSGKEKDKKIWDAVSSEMEKQTGASMTEIIEAGDYQTLRQYRSMYMLAGGDMDMFDARIVKNTKTALKKSIVDNPSDQQIIAQASMRAYLRSHGMTAADVSDVVYRTDAKTDLQVAMRINDEEAIETELAKLSQAGITQEDIDKAYKYRRRVDLKKYKANDGKYADKLKSTGQYEWPISGSITSRFTGNKVRTDVNTGRPHTGLDIAAASGTPVGAADGGTVVYAGWYSGAGKTVMIEHDDGTVTQYSHLSWYDAHVGDTVGQGETIGNVGSTGNSTGPHLHFAVKVNGSYEDPLDYLSAR